jgi:hypothetical protein
LLAGTEARLTALVIAFIMARCSTSAAIVPIVVKSPSLLPRERAKMVSPSSHEMNCKAENRTVGVAPFWQSGFLVLKMPLCTLL